MSVRGTLSGLFAATAVLIVGWQAGTAVSDGALTGTSTTGPTGTTGTTGPPSTGGSSTISPSPSGTAGPGLTDGTYAGSSYDTKYGAVQVKVAVASGKITDVTAVRLTDRDPRSRQISNRAAPVLREKILAAQSAQVDYVSGATFTSVGYLRSAQSALDQAKP